jgi:hypothetical protein
MSSPVDTAPSLVRPAAGAPDTSSYLAWELPGVHNHALGGQECALPALDDLCASVLGEITALASSTSSQCAEDAGACGGSWGFGPTTTNTAATGRLAGTTAARAAAPAAPLAQSPGCAAASSSSGGEQGVLQPVNVSSRLSTTAALRAVPLPAGTKRGLFEGRVRGGGVRD